MLAAEMPGTARCRKVNLGYRDPKSIDHKQWMNREAEGCPCARKTLCRLS